ncbi:MAG: hypothetical protein ACLQMU_00025 [Methanoregula sp.]|uniref:hypothetical protein n=1 Tax=Methanoregula sp. TaxID=2052170 RepID=UPI003C36F8C6
MDRQEHIHIIGAGEEIGAACAAAIRDLQDITRIFVFADSELYSNSSRDDERTKAHKTAVRVAVNGTKALAASLKIPASLVYIDPPASGTVAAAVQKIKSGYPGARCTFDLSGGSKDLSLALFQVSLWLEGDAYYAYAGPRGAGPSEKLAVPKIPLRDIAANPNYLRILTVLSDPPGKAETAPRILPRSYLFTQLEPFYVPVRTKGVKTNTSTTKTDATTGKRAVIPVLSQGTFSSMMNTLASADLVQEVPGPAGNRKEKYYRITASGTLAMQLA